LKIVFYPIFLTQKWEKRCDYWQKCSSIPWCRHTAGEAEMQHCQWQQHHSCWRPVTWGWHTVTALWRRSQAGHVAGVLTPTANHSIVNGKKNILFSSVFLIFFRASRNVSQFKWKFQTLLSKKCWIYASKNNMSLC